MAQEFIYQRLCETVAPIFDQERGRRLKFMRQALLLDQKELGQKLGVPQQTIAKLELGQVRVGRHPVTLSQFYKIFGCATHHILFGLDAGSYNYQSITDKYWGIKNIGKGDRSTIRLTKRQREKLLRKKSFGR